jgi:hypothetical protein
MGNEVMNVNENGITGNEINTGNENSQLDSNNDDQSTVKFDHAVEIANYPRRFLDVFDENDIAFDKIPVLDLKGRMGGTDYIDFIDPEEFPDNTSMMLFKDQYGRVGIALKIKIRPTIFKKKDRESAKPFCEKFRTLALFQRYTDNMEFWSFGWGHSYCSFEHEVSEYYRKFFPNSSSSPFSLEYIHFLLNRLLHDNDPCLTF